MEAGRIAAKLAGRQDQVGLFTFNDRLILERNESEALGHAGPESAADSPVGQGSDWIFRVQRVAAWEPCASPLYRTSYLAAQTSLEPSMPKSSLLSPAVFMSLRICIERRSMRHRGTTEGVSRPLRRALLRSADTLVGLASVHRSRSQPSIEGLSNRRCRPATACFKR